MCIRDSYYEGNYVDAKRDFAIRSGLMPDERQFTPEQLIEIYQQCSFICFSCSLPPEQEHIIDEIQQRIQELVPDYEERIARGMEPNADSDVYKRQAHGLTLDAPSPGMAQAGSLDHAQRN